MRNKFLIFTVLSILVTVIGTVFAITFEHKKGLMQDAYVKEEMTISFASSAIEVGLANGLIPYIQSTMKELQEDESFNGAVVFDEDMTPMMSAPSEFELSDAIMEKLETASGQIKSGPVSVFEGQLTYALSSILDEDGEQLGYLMLSFDRGVIQSTINKSMLYAAGVATIIALLVIAFVAWQVTIMIAPISGAARSMKDLVEGDTNINIVGTSRKDEVGEMARALEVFRENAVEKLQFEATQAQVEKLAEEEKIKERNQLADSFEDKVSGIIQSVTAAADQLYQNSELVCNVVENTSEKVESVSKASTETSENVQAVASATEEMSASVQEISQQISRSDEAVSAAVSEMQKADQTSKELEEATDRIGEIVTLIEDIAAQINLLALNATIESARAGDAGRGFAVVASEVKSLATQTTSATSEIGESISNIREVSKQVVGALDSIRETVGGVHDISAAISNAVQEQGTVTSEISSSMSTASTGTSQISEDIEDVSHSSNEASASASETLSAAKSLSSQAEELNREVETFLREIRAA